MPAVRVDNLSKSNRKTIRVNVYNQVVKEVKTMAPRDTYKYHLKQGNKIIRSGITNNLDRREKELQQEYGENVHITKVGNATTRDGARNWEKEQKHGTP